MIISLDIETYGAFEKFDQGGQACPDQTAFNPHLSSNVDGVSSPYRQTPQCAVTIVNGTLNKPQPVEAGIHRRVRHVVRGSR
jgi:hypothetical protein